MITDEHRAFARELVALARKHGVNHVNMEFNFGSHKKFREETISNRMWERVTLRWAEGRHGDLNDITLETRAADTFKETP